MDGTPEVQLPYHHTQIGYPMIAALALREHRAAALPRAATRATTSRASGCTRPGCCCSSA